MLESIMSFLLGISMAIFSWFLAGRLERDKTASIISFIHSRIAAWIIATSLLIVHLSIKMDL